MYFVDRVQWMPSLSSAPVNSLMMSSDRFEKSHAAVVGDHATAVAVDQPADELLGFVINDGLLPRFEHDAQHVFPAWAVLREQAWPVLGHARYVCAPGTRPKEYARRRHNASHR